MNPKETILALFPDEANEIEPLFNWDLIEWYYHFLTDNNEAGGFFSKKDAEVILERHLSESLYHIYFLIREGFVSRETIICDAGTGPGLPGFLFFCLNDPPDITLLDSQIKRLKLLHDKLAESPFMNNRIAFIYARAEDVKNKFDVLVSRSFIPYPFSAEASVNLVRGNGYYIPFLGQKDPDEALEKRILKNCGYSLEKILELKKLSFLGRRHIKLLKKTGSPVQGYPRPWKVIIKEIQTING